MREMRVLVVDDSEDVRLLVKDIVEQSGHTAVAASNGREAWELLDRGGKFSFIISDNNMPEMTGVELLQRLRADARTASIPFILMSGGRVVSDDDPTPLEDVCARYSAHVMKNPFSVFSLLAMFGVGMEMTT